MGNNDIKKDHEYARFLASFSREAIEHIVQIKRFFEWMEGDPEFAEAVVTDSISSKQRQRLKTIGVAFDPAELRLFWQEKDIFASLIQGGCQVDDYLEKHKDLLAGYPLVELWLEFFQKRMGIYQDTKTQICELSEVDNPRFDAWRRRRVASCRSELGHFGYHIDHPVFAFELGDGCSVGCWFCAFAANKLTKNFEYESNRTYFRNIIKKCVNLFGANTAGLSMLYYGTEPHDNPGYVKFMRDFSDITGHAVCTSTAVCTDVPWLREVIGYYRERNLPWPRLSVLSRKVLYNIHDLYSPMELRDVSLLMQMKDHERCKVTGGRIFEEQGGLKEREDGKYLDTVVSQGSISCISGFLVNMVKESVELISPCYTSAKWPFGYRVFDEIEFEGAEGFQGAIEALIERNMPENYPFPDAIAAFRDDLVYNPRKDGFDLVSSNQIHHFKESKLYKDMGELISRGNLKYKALYDLLIDQKRHNPLVVSAMVKQFFNSGFVNEVLH